MVIRLKGYFMGQGSARGYLTQYYSVGQGSAHDSFHDSAPIEDDSPVEEMSPVNAKKPSKRAAKAKKVDGKN